MTEYRHPGSPNPYDMASTIGAIEHLRRMDDLMTEKNDTAQFSNVKALAIFATFALIFYVGSLL